MELLEPAESYPLRDIAGKSTFVYACKKLTDHDEALYNLRTVSVVHYFPAGRFEYIQGDRCFSCTPGTAILCPAGSDYTVRVLEQGERLSIRFSGAIISPPELTFYSGFRRKEMENAFNRAVSFYLSRDETAFFKCQIQLCRVFLLLAESRCHYEPRHKRELIQPALTYMRDHLCDPEFSVGKMLALVDISEPYFFRLFSAYYHMPPQQYVISERLALARDILMHDPDTTIREVAETVGYPDAFYFSRLFKKHTGESPAQFARRCRNDESDILP